MAVRVNATVYDLKPGDRVAVRCWGYGSRLYQLKTKSSERWRWKIAIVKWVGSISNAYGCYVCFVRPRSLKEKDDFISYERMRIPRPCRPRNQKPFISTKQAMTSFGCSFT